MGAKYPSDASSAKASSTRGEIARFALVGVAATVALVPIVSFLFNKRYEFRSRVAEN